MSDKHTILRVEMLGGFTIIANGNRIVVQSKKTSKVWRLIQYLVTHRNRAVSQEELLDIFCSDENKGNPGSVLRTMVYRARAVLAESGLECATDIISAKSGCYSWNNSIKCTTDIEEIEEFSKKAASSSDDNEKLALLLQVAKLYKGDFLHGSSGDMWAISLVRWYRSIYINAAHEALDLLMKLGRVAEAEELSTKALSIDPFDESLIKNYLQTLLAQKKNSEALAVYKKMEEMFFDELGVDFSDELRALYDEISKSDVAEDTPLQEVMINWLTDADASKKNIYYCDHSDFKVLCQIESRSAARTGRTTYIIRFDTKHEPNSRQIAKGGGVMKSLEKAITVCLRKSDVFTRCSPSQYMVMLRSLTYEDCKMIVSRILNKVDSKYLSKIIETSIIQVAPADKQVHLYQAEKFRGEHTGV